jgi:hypothetical protein
MSDHANQPRERVIAIDAGNTSAPTSGVGSALTQPQITLSPKCPGGEPCRGFAVTLFEPFSDDPPEGGTGAPQPDEGGFTITFYRLNTSAGVWAKCRPYTGAAYGDQLVCYDFGGGTALYAVISNSVIGEGDSTILHMLIAELP